jgi:hypothetical protein
MTASGQVRRFRDAPRGVRISSYNGHESGDGYDFEASSRLRLSSTFCSCFGEVVTHERRPRPRPETLTKSTVLRIP